MISGLHGQVSFQTCQGFGPCKATAMDRRCAGPLMTAQGAGSTGQAVAAQCSTTRNDAGITDR